jgi:hypothetical protein
MKGPNDLTRRELLASTTAAGAVGLGAASTGAVLSDVSSFDNNTMAAGKVDLALCWQRDGDETCQPSAGETLRLDIGSLSAGDSGSGCIRLELPDEGEANPAWVWGKTACPIDACGLYDALKLDLWYDLDGDGERDDGEPPVVVDGTELTDVSLCRLTKLLANGVLFDGTPTDDEPAAIQPGTDRCIGVAWRVEGGFCPPAEAALDFQFYAEQHRHNPEPTVPWDPVDCEVDCTQECDDCYPASFVAFCLDSVGTISKEDVIDLSWTADTVTFRLDRQIDSAILFYGPPTFEIFDGGFQANTEYTIERGTGNQLQEADAEDQYGMTQQDPCPDIASDGCGVRYNFDGGAWDCVCGPPGSDRSCGDNE